MDILSIVKFILSEDYILVNLYYRQKNMADHVQNDKFCLLYKYSKITLETWNKNKLPGLVDNLSS